MLIVILAPKKGNVAVFVAPWAPKGAIINVIQSADGALINGGQASWIGIANSHSDGFVHKLYHSGAWLVIDGTLAAACLKSF